MWVSLWGVSGLSLFRSSKICRHRVESSPTFIRLFCTFFLISAPGFCVFIAQSAHANDLDHHNLFSFYFLPPSLSPAYVCVCVCVSESVEQVTHIT